MTRVLWALDDASREAVLGVCLSVDLLRRIADAEAVRADAMSDYALHMAVVVACAEDNALSRAVQALLVQDHAATVARFARDAHDDVQLLALWKHEAGSGHCAAALWACMTHAHCNARVREHVLQDLRMVQYRALAGARGDMERARSLAVENSVLVHSLARIQQRYTDWQRQRDAERRQMQGELARLRRALEQGRGMPGGAAAAA
jgi:hypothetical protein